MAKQLMVWTVKDICEMIDTMTSAEVKFDFVCFIEGARGLGKSTLAYKILTRLNVEHPFNPKRDIVYSREETLSQLANKINGCIFSDEMINVAYKRDFYAEDQKELLKAFDMYRDSRNVFIGCIPQFMDLDIKLQKLCKIRISVIRRGIALIQTKIQSLNNNDPWDIKNNQRIESNWTTRGNMKPKYGQLTTVRGIMHFGDLTPQQRAEYDAIKTEKRGHVFAKYQKDGGQPVDAHEMFMSNVISKMKTGEMNLDTYKLMCSVNSKDPMKLRNQINGYLKTKGENITFRHLVPPKAKAAKRNIVDWSKEIEVSN